MENLTHTLLGGILAKTGLERWTRLATPALLIGANLPDIDVLFAPRGVLTYLVNHRGITHAVVGTLGLAALLAMVLWGFDWLRGRRHLSDGRPLSFARLFVLSLIGTASHTFLDWTNSYGVRPWLPFDDRWVYGDFVFIADPWLWLILGGPLVCLTLRRTWHVVGYAIAAGILSWLIMIAAANFTPEGVKWVWGLGLLAILVALWLRVGRYGSRLAIGALAAVVLYWAGLGLTHYAAKTRATRYVDAHLQDHPDHRLSVLPEPADPFGWQFVVETSRTLYTGRVDLLGQTDVQGPVESIPRALDDQVVQAALRTPSGQAMMKFARYPFAEVEQTASGYTVILRDLRFGRPSRDGFAVVRIPLNGHLLRIEAFKRTVERRHTSFNHHVQ